MSKELSARNDGSNFFSSTGPDVCLTPIGSEMVPVAYSIIAPLDNIVQESTTVFNNSQTDVQINTRSTEIFGHELGTGCGICSGGYRAYCFAAKSSATVASEGFGIVCDQHPAWLNSPTVGQVESRALTIIKRSKTEDEMYELMSEEYGDSAFYWSGKSWWGTHVKATEMKELRLRIEEFRDQFNDNSLNSANATGVTNIGTTETPSNVYCEKVINAAVKQKEKLLKEKLEEMAENIDNYPYKYRPNLGNQPSEKELKERGIKLKHEYDELNSQPLWKFGRVDPTRVRACLEYWQMAIQGAEIEEKLRKQEIDSKYNFERAQNEYRRKKGRDYEKSDLFNSSDSDVQDHLIAEAQISSDKVIGNIFAKQHADGVAQFNSFNAETPIDPAMTDLFEWQDNHTSPLWELPFINQTRWGLGKRYEAIGNQYLGGKYTKDLPFTAVLDFSVFSELRALRLLVPKGLVKIGDQQLAKGAVKIALKKVATGESITATERSVLKYAYEQCMKRGCLAGGKK